MLTSNVPLQENLSSNLTFSERIDKAYTGYFYICVCGSLLMFSLFT